MVRRGHWFAVGIVRLPLLLTKWLVVAAAVLVWLVIVPLVDAIRQTFNRLRGQGPG
jgi:hypothetical protein